RRIRRMNGGMRDAASILETYSLSLIRLIRSFSPPSDKDEDSRWYERLRLQGMEGSVLPRGLERRRDARLLLKQVSDGRDQQHVLSAAQGEGVARLGGAG